MQEENEGGKMEENGVVCAEARYGAQKEHFIIALS